MGPGDPCPWGLFLSPQAQDGGSGPGTAPPEGLSLSPTPVCWDLPGRQSQELWGAPGTGGLLLAPPELSDVLPVLTHPYRPENTHFWGFLYQDCDISPQLVQVSFDSQRVPSPGILCCQRDRA